MSKTLPIKSWSDSWSKRGTVGNSEPLLLVPTTEVKIYVEVANG